MTAARLRDGGYWSYPYHDYEGLQRETPVHYDPYLAAWLVTSHDAVAEALRHPGLSSAWIEHREDAATPGADFVHSILGRWFVFTDHPEHERLRAPVGRIFAARSIAALRPVVEMRVNELFDAAATHGGPVDVISEIAFPLSASIINGLIGLDPAHEASMPRWGSVLARYLAHAWGTEALADTTVVLREIEDAISARLRDEHLPLESVIHRFVDATAEADASGVLEAVGTASLLLYTGMEATSMGVGLVTLTLLDQPELRRAIDPADPAAVSQAVDELLRYDTPVLQIPRIAATDLDLAGVRIPCGDLVVVLLGAANHDAARYGAPHAVDLDATANAGRHLTFGLGAHYCIGAALARIEIETYMAALLRRAPDVAATAPPTWAQTTGTRALQSLVVDLAPGADAGA